MTRFEVDPEIRTSFGLSVAADGAENNAEDETEHRRITEGALEALREQATVADLAEDQAERVQKAAGPKERVTVEADDTPDRSGAFHPAAIAIWR